MIGGAEPVVKWAGGKRQLLDKLVPLMPEEITEYYEPFAGGCAMLFFIQPHKAHVNDINSELIQTYIVIRDKPDALINELKQYENTSECYYEVRNWDRDKTKYAELSDVVKASRLLYLNRVCFNGLYRVNSKGEFNVPMGRYKNPDIVNEKVIRADSAYFNSADIEFTSQDFRVALENVSCDSFVYLDPPYDATSRTASFSSYAKSGFTKNDQISLKICCNKLDGIGAKFMESNAETDFIKEQYKFFNIDTVKARRYISGILKNEVNEIVIRNYS